jgi:hypothetical protein
MFKGLFYGSIEDVYPPNHTYNRSKTQYEYKVLITHDAYSQIPTHCIRLDSYGSYHNFEDAILAKGYRVLVQFPREEGTVGVIIGGIRSVNNKPIKSEEGYFYRQRFNEIETYINNLGTWQVKSDDGPSITLSKDKVILDDSKGDKITLDKVTKTITVECQDWNVVVRNNVTIQVNNDAIINVANSTTLTTKNLVANTENATINTSQKAVINSKQTATVNANKVELNAKGDVNIKAGKILLNGKAGQGNGILTSNGSYGVVDMISGLPLKPSLTVFGDI